MDWRGGLERLPALLENLVARINTVWKKQHDTAGAHTNITGTSAVLTTSLRVGTYTGTPPVGVTVDWPDMLRVDAAPGAGPGKAANIQLAAVGDIEIFSDDNVRVVSEEGASFGGGVGSLVMSATPGGVLLNSTTTLAVVAAADVIINSTGDDVHITSDASDVIITADDNVNILSDTADVAITAASEILLSGTPVDLLLGRLKFPASQNPSADANTLDDYEEGTWTPALEFGGGTTGITYSGTRNGTYVKVGQLVSVYFRFTLSSKGSDTGNASVTGLPFANDGTIDGTGGGAFCNFGGNFDAAVKTAPLGYVAGSGIALLFWDGGNITALTDTHFTNTTDLIMQAVYKASA
jgi:hypothetical protein